MDFLNCVIISVLSLLTGFSIAGTIFRRHLQNTSKRSQALSLVLEDKAAQIKEQKKALQELIYQFHHSGLNPKCKRLRGISDLGLRPIKVLKENLELLSRPNHHGYAKLALKEVLEMETWWKTSIQVCIDIEKEVLDSANKFNHLQ